MEKEGSPIPDPGGKPFDSEDGPDYANQNILKASVQIWPIHVGQVYSILTEQSVVLAISASALAGKCALH